ncbi:hypothetical protein LPJ56_000813 [Coemansia sp. RSA 2599]|nr:hypothetical protein LPJ75_000403 [Coemansia sp. RSA 2598]KAJ1828881.1 hypothetical protein LPJ56_000813 [Coemansia sp. RSA 2599]
MRFEIHRLWTLAGHVPLRIVSVGVVLIALFFSIVRFSPSSRIHNHCQAVQRDGWWADKASLQWQPKGCTLHQYTQHDLQLCLQPMSDRSAQVVSEHMLFIGDSSMRDKYHALARLIDPDLASLENQTATAAAHEDLSIGWPIVGGVVARFLWDPYLNSSRTQEILEGSASPADRPKVLVVGSGAWYLRYKDASGGLEAWRRTMDQLAKDISNMWQRSSSGDDEGDSVVQHVYVSPVTDVVPDLLTPDRQRTLKPDRISAMNEYIEAIDLPVLSAWAHMAKGAPFESRDGLHYSAALNDRAVNVLLNRVCNARVVSREARPPLHTTCCFEYPPPNWYAVAMALAVSLAVPMLLLLLLLKPRNKARGMAFRLVPSAATLQDMLAFGAVLLLMYIFDRTPLFDKLHKVYDARVFALLMAAVAAGGAMSWQEHSRDLASNNGNNGNEANGFMNRQQTDEWKGWMQLVILTYHLTNASSVAGIYNAVRVLVAMYLFMTGYGHCCYLYEKRDFGLRRLTLVLLRLNILAASLAYAMNTSYMDYYFAPLSSVWTLVVWATMAVGSRFNDSRLVWIKLCVAAAATWQVNRHHLWPFAALSRVGVHWDQREWEFRFGLDAFVVYAGMAVALVRLQHGQRLVAHARWPQMQRWAVLLSVVALLWYLGFELAQESKYAYNAWHPLVSPMVVLAFVVLRNATAYLRSRSSALFRAAGRISLELFIAQFHMFLAADTKAVLVLVHPRLWLTNLVAVSVVFGGLCQVLASASSTIVAWLMAAPPLADPHDSAATAMMAMAEIGHADHGLARPALDRLATDRRPPSLALALALARRMMQHVDIFARRSLAVRWTFGLAALVLLNHFY